MVDDDPQGNSNPKGHMVSWYVNIEGIAHGPIPYEQIIVLVNSYRLRRTDLVWREGTGKWILAECVPGLVFPDPVDLRFAESLHVSADESDDDETSEAGNLNRVPLPSFLNESRDDLLLQHKSEVGNRSNNEELTMAASGIPSFCPQTTTPRRESPFKVSKILMYAALSGSVFFWPDPHESLKSKRISTGESSHDFVVARQKKDRPLRMSGTLESLQSTTSRLPSSSHLISIRSSGSTLVGESQVERGLIQTKTTAIKVCNRTDQAKLYFSLAFIDPSDGRWRAKGWFSSYKGECSTPFKSVKGSVYGFAESVDRSIQWGGGGGGKLFCIDPGKKFDFLENRCARGDSRSRKIQKFKKLNHMENSGNIIWELVE